MSRRILFVDDEPLVLEGLQRMLSTMREEWDMQFVSGADEALRAMAVQRFDLLVTDMHMPGMDGATLLAHVAEHHPGVIRFILTGHSDVESIHRTVSIAHQFIGKPCDPTILKSSIARTFTIRESVGTESVRQFVSQVGSLPTLPDAYRRLVKALESPDVALSDVADIVATDVGMTAKILQLANSAFFGLRRHVSSVAQAVALLGLDTVRALVLVTGLFDQAKEHTLCSALDLDMLWRHSLRVGIFAQSICRAEHAPPSVVSDGFTSGLLHDCGILVLGANGGVAYQRVLEGVQRTGAPLAEVERVSLGCTHGEVGAYLLGLWGLPDSIVEAVAFHHDPDRSPCGTFIPLTAVHCANAFTRILGNEPDLAGKTPIEMSYVTRLGLNSRIAAWRSACESSCHEGMGHS